MFLWSYFKLVNVYKEKWNCGPKCILDCDKFFNAIFFVNYFIYLSSQYFQLCFLRMSWCTALPWKCQMKPCLKISSYRLESARLSVKVSCANCNCLYIFIFIRFKDSKMTSFKNFSCFLNGQTKVFTKYIVYISYLISVINYC